MRLTIELSDDEKTLAENFAKLHGLSLDEAFKGALFEKIEDEYDVAVAQSAYDDYIRSGKKSYPISELWKELDL